MRFIQALSSSQVLADKTKNDPNGSHAEFRARNAKLMRMKRLGDIARLGGLCSKFLQSIALSQPVPQSPQRPPHPDLMSQYGM